MDSEIFDKAHDILSQRRIKATAENNLRVTEINEKIPEIKEINDALFNTGRDLIRIITEAKGKDVSDKIESLKQNNLEAQKLAQQLLASNGFPADYLDMHYTCPKCSDTGYIGNETCSCLNQLYAKLSVSKLNQKAQIELSSFDTFSLDYYSGNDRSAMERILNYTKKYASTFTTKSDSILIFGDTGLGKTHISLAIANEVIQSGYSVIYDSVINLLREIEKEHFSHNSSSDTLDLILDVDLLILDDLGTEFESKFYNSVIYNIVNTRINRKLPTIISTNMDFSAISARYSGKIASRIITMYECLEFKGDDIRLQKKIKKNQSGLS